MKSGRTGGPCPRWTEWIPFPSEGRENVSRESADHEVLWSEAVAFTRGRSPGSFDQWFSGIQFDGLTDGVLGLRARDEFVREWVDEHFLPTLTDHLRAKTGLSIQVAWTIDGILDSPVVERIRCPRLRPSTGCLYILWRCFHVTFSTDWRLTLSAVALNRDSVAPRSLSS